MIYFKSNAIKIPKVADLTERILTRVNIYKTLCYFFIFRFSSSFKVTPDHNVYRMKNIYQPNMCICKAGLCSTDVSNEYCDEAGDKRN